MRVTTKSSFGPSAIALANRGVGSIRKVLTYRLDLPKQRAWKNVAHVFVGATLTVEFQFAENHVFSRRKSDRRSFDRILFCIAKSPGIHFITIDGVKIGFQS